LLFLSWTPYANFRKIVLNNNQCNKKIAATAQFKEQAISTLRQIFKSPLYDYETRKQTDILYSRKYNHKYFYDAMMKLGKIRHQVFI